jgi:hypothetical protein
MARATRAFGEREHGLAKSMNPRKLGKSKLWKVSAPVPEKPVQGVRRPLGILDYWKSRNILSLLAQKVAKE